MVSVQLSSTYSGTLGFDVASDFSSYTTEYYLKAFPNSVPKDIKCNSGDQTVFSYHESTATPNAFFIMKHWADNDPSKTADIYYKF